MDLPEMPILYSSHRAGCYSHFTATEDIMNRNERYIAAFLVMALVLTFNLTCKKGSKPVVQKKQVSTAVSGETDLRKILASFRTETLDTRKIITAHYIGTPADDTVAKFLPAGEIGKYRKYTLTVYASPTRKDGRVPDKVYVWTHALAQTKSAHKSSFFVIDSAKTLRGERYGYAYITGDILLDERREIVLVTFFDGKVTAVEYYNPDGSKSGRRASFKEAL